MAINLMRVEICLALFCIDLHRSLILDLINRMISDFRGVLNVGNVQVQFVSVTFDMLIRVVFYLDRVSGLVLILIIIIGINLILQISPVIDRRC